METSGKNKKPGRSMRHRKPHRDVCNHNTFNFSGRKRRHGPGNARFLRNFQRSVIQIWDLR